jgi:hypothetical protein
VHIAIFIVVLLVLPVISGCGEPQNRTEVSGTIRVNGKPLPEGSIAFRPTDGNEGPSSGGEIVNGAYYVARAKGAATGKNLVLIRSAASTGRKVERFGRLEDERTQVIPPKYNERSEIVRDLQPGSNQLDFDLKVAPQEWPNVRFLKGK